MKRWQPLAWSYIAGAGPWLVLWVVNLGARGVLVWIVCHGGSLLGLRTLDPWLAVVPPVALVVLIVAALRRAHPAWFVLLAPAIFGWRYGVG